MSKRWFSEGSLRRFRAEPQSRLHDPAKATSHRHGMHTRTHNLHKHTHQPIVNPHAGVCVSNVGYLCSGERNCGRCGGAGGVRSEKRIKPAGWLIALCKNKKNKQSKTQSFVSLRFLPGAPPSSELLVRQSSGGEPRFCSRWGVPDRAATGGGLKRCPG